MKYEKFINLGLTVDNNKINNINISNNNNVVIPLSYCPKINDTYNLAVNLSHLLIYISDDSFNTLNAYFIKQGKEIDIHLDKGVSYNVKAILIPEYSESTANPITFPEGELCFYNEKIYKANKDNTDNIPFVYGNWTEIHIYNDRVYIMTTKSSEKDYSVGMITCSDIYTSEYIKTSCHNYTVEANILTTKKRIVFLYSSKMVEISRYILDVGETDKKIVTPGDNVYIIEIYEYDDASSRKVGDVLIQFPIYDVCDAELCYESLILKLNCCTYQSCNDIKKYDEEKLRYTLNKFVGIMYFINRYMRIEADMYLGIYVIDDTRMQHIERVAKLFTIINLIINNCTECEIDEELANC